MRSFLAGSLACTLLVGAFASPLMGQGELKYPVGEKIPWQMDTGAFRGGGLVFSTLIEVEDAAWMRLFFDDETVLGVGTTIRVTGVLDDVTQELGAAQLEEWNFTTAYFNGNALLLEVFSQNPNVESRIILDEIYLNWMDPGLPAGGCGICGADGREPSNIPWSGRIVSVGCTGSIYNQDSCIVSAGHCRGNNQVMQFNVPPSSSGCNIRNPGPEDQFPINNNGLSENNGPGDDWWVATTGTNNLGQTIFERYGVFIPFRDSAANSGESVNVFGYGVDSQCTRSQTQQESGVGPITSRTGSYYNYDTHSTFGNSGSGLPHVNSNTLIGVVTHCRDNCPNVATRHDVADFAAARQQICPDEPPPGECPGNCNDPTNYGNGTAGSGGFVPQLTWDSESGCSHIGNDRFTMDITQALGGASGTLLVGFASVNDNSAGWTRLVEPAVIIPIGYGGGGAGNGNLNLVFSIPNNPFLLGLNVYMQATVFDAGAGSGVAATDGLSFTICN